MGWKDAPVVGEGQAYQQAPEVSKAVPSALQTAARVAQTFARGGPIALAGEAARGALEGLDKVGDAAGGTATDIAARAGAPPEVAAGLGTVLKVGIPASISAVPARAVGQPAMEFAARRTMQSALKPTSKSIANGEAARAIDTMLKEGANATTGGALKLRRLITELKGQVGKVISESPGTLVDKSHVFRELQSTLDDVAKQGTPQGPMDAVRKAWEAFKNHPLLKPDEGTIPLQLADEIKRGTQHAVKDAYGRITSTPADDKAQMAIATGLRKGMEEARPEIGPMNAKLSQYINALHQIEPKAAMAANKDLGGLVPLAHSPEAAMIMLADRNPWMKSLIARVLFEGRKSIPATAGAVAAQGNE